MSSLSPAQVSSQTLDIWGRGRGFRANEWGNGELAKRVGGGQSDGNNGRPERMVATQKRRSSFKGGETSFYDPVWFRVRPAVKRTRKAVRTIDEIDGGEWAKWGRCRFFHKHRVTSKILPTDKVKSRGGNDHVISQSSWIWASSWPGAILPVLGEYDRQQLEDKAYNLRRECPGAAGCSALSTRLGLWSG